MTKNKMRMRSSETFKTYTISKVLKSIEIEKNNP
jgi:hypothetical protein